jgi:hypothetical protein
MSKNPLENDLDDEDFIIFKTLRANNFSVFCPPGTYQSLNEKKCIPCENNTISAENAGSCTPCTNGTVANFKRTRCGLYLLITGRLLNLS